MLQVIEDSDAIVADVSITARADAVMFASDSTNALTFLINAADAVIEDSDVICEATETINVALQVTELSLVT